MTKAELEQCISAYGKDIYSFCVYLTGSIQEAEDLYQDTFLKAVEHTDRIRTDKNPKSYLLGTALHIWKSRKRKLAWRKRIVDMQSLTEEKDTGQWERMEQSAETCAVVLHGRAISCTDRFCGTNTDRNSKKQTVSCQKDIRKRIGGCFK